MIERVKGCVGRCKILKVFFLSDMQLLNGIKDITIHVEGRKYVIFGGVTEEYTLTKANFRTEFDCPDSHCEIVSIHDEISELIKARKTENVISKLCPGKDEIGHRCNAGFKFTISISYID